MTAPVHNNVVAGDTIFEVGTTGEVMYGVIEGTVETHFKFLVQETPMFALEVIRSLSTWLRALKAAAVG
ncbi:MAG: hypothetical protein WBG32_08315 [Nodosilinea sp.]